MYQIKSLTLKRSLTALKSEDNGSSTIEFVLWFPIMVFLLLLAAQGAILFMAQANYGYAARETARLVSRHAITADEAKSRLVSSGTFGAAMATADVEVDKGTVVVTVSARANDLAPVDVFGLTEGLIISARIVHEMEPM